MKCAYCGVDDGPRIRPCRCMLHFYVVRGGKVLDGTLVGRPDAAGVMVVHPDSPIKPEPDDILRELPPPFAGIPYHQAEHNAADFFKK